MQLRSLISISILMSLFLGGSHVFAEGNSSSAPTSAKKENLLLETTISFNEKGKAQVSYDSKSSSQDVLTNKINSALVLYAYVMHHTKENQRVPLLNQVQRSVQKIATGSGLKRADLITGNSLANLTGKEIANKGLKIALSKELGKGNSIEVIPLEGSEEILLPSVFYMFQDLTDNLSENGLRFMVLAMGAMNKCYREVPGCKGENAESMVKAPSYGLNLAVQIISKVTGAEIK
ncbi:MAG: hypothetical protein H7A32_05510 [Deltaproteobacteria bacterium]|nr:hypothetical protein [Deltaproteobacteria bacterium]